MIWFSDNRKISEDNKRLDCKTKIFSFDEIITLARLKSKVIIQKFLARLHVTILSKKDDYEKLRLK